MKRMLDEVDLFCQEITPQRAVVYARCPRPSTGETWTLSGRVRGPQSRIAQTLPANSVLRDLGDGESLLAVSLVTDPCRWTPAAPAYYQVDLELRSNGQIVEQDRRPFGIRQCVVQNGGLFLSSERWILRAARTTSTASTNLRDWHEAPLAQVVDGLDPQTFAAALVEGCFVVADFSGVPVNEIEHAVRQAAKFSAVGIVVLPANCGMESSRLRKLAPNLLLARRFETDAPNPVDRFDADLIWTSATPSAEMADRLLRIGLPTMVERRLIAPAASVAEARLACDRLQADWASYGQFAGYVV